MFSLLGAPHVDATGVGLRERGVGGMGTCWALHMGFGPAYCHWASIQNRQAAKCVNVKGNIHQPQATTYSVGGHLV